MVDHITYLKLLKHEVSNHVQLMSYIFVVCINYLPNGACMFQYWRDKEKDVKSSIKYKEARIQKPWCSNYSLWFPGTHSTKPQKMSKRFFFFFFFKAVRFAPLKGYHFPSVNFFVFCFLKLCHVKYAKTTDLMEGDGDRVMIK